MVAITSFSFYDNGFYFELVILIKLQEIHFRVTCHIAVHCCTVCIQNYRFSVSFKLLDNVRVGGGVEDGGSNQFFHYTRSLISGFALRPD